ncbi:hypothetical protein QYF36_009413 [Acer negundo]|nr:hypothetical protein QYF36_009413 [Acer negundo]
MSSSLVWFNAFLLFLLISTHGIATEISYYSSRVTHHSTRIRFLAFSSFSKGYSDGGDRILNPNPSNYLSLTITSLIRGTLSSVDDQSYFEPISILMFPEKNYQYTKTSNEFENVAESSTSLSLDMVRSICSVLAFPINKFRLEYAGCCNFAKTCNPLGDDHVGFLPQLMFSSPTECSPDGQSVRCFIEFPNSSSYDGFQINPFNPNAKFVGEGTWYWKKIRLSVVACRFTKKND